MSSGIVLESRTALPHDAPGIHPTVHRWHLQSWHLPFMGGTRRCQVIAAQFFIFFLGNHRDRAAAMHYGRLGPETHSFSGYDLTRS
jgi:hypothetical protein